MRTVATVSSLELVSQPLQAQVAVMEEAQTSAHQQLVVLVVAVETARAVRLVQRIKVALVEQVKVGLSSEAAAVVVLTQLVLGQMVGMVFRQA